MKGSKIFSTIVHKSITEEQLKEYFNLLSEAKDVLVSLVVPLYNVQDTLEVHLKSLFTQSTLIPYELIFVDNNSTDQSAIYLKNLGARVISEKKQGVNFARQAGLEVANGVVVLSLDPDTIYGPSYIDDMAIPFFLDSEIVLAWNSSRAYKGKFQLTSKLKLRNELKAIFNKHNHKKGGLDVIKSVRAHGLAVRTSVALKAGYNQELAQTSGCDDGIFSLQLFSAGKIQFVETLLWTQYANNSAKKGLKYPWNKSKVGYSHSI